MRALRCGAIFAAAALVAACTQIARVDIEAPVIADTPFAASGRLSARHGDDALSANFDWRHRLDGDAIVLATPLGQTLATLDRDGETVSLVLADGRHASADSFDALTAKAFGVPLPVSGLTWWIRGNRKEVSSPVGIVEGSSEALSQGLQTYLWVLGLLSLSLALLNLLPLLPLDGGHIVFSIVEGIRGRAVGREVYERVSAIGIAVVLLLFFIGLSNDIGNLGG